VDEPDSLQMHLNADGELEFGRVLLHVGIVEDLFEGHGRYDTSHVVFMAGGPASGKSTLARQLKLPDDVVRIDPDDIRILLPEYEVWQHERPADAARLTHREASDIAKRAYGFAVRRGHNIIYDAVGGDDTGGFSEKIAAAIDQGQIVWVYYATVTVEVALARESARFADTGRRVPEQVLRRGHAQASRGLRTVSTLQIERIEIYDTTDQPARLLARGAGGHGVDGLEVVDPAGYAAFLEKGYE
jgi:predicted ABC-type ATPase